MARTQRTLKDLYAVGRVVRLPDPKHPDVPIVVWMQKLDPSDHDAALRKANAARARTRVTYQDTDSEEYLALLDQLHGIVDRENMIGYLVAEDTEKILRSCEAELELEDESEWVKDNYLQGLRDAWETGGTGADGDARPLRDVYVDEPEHPEVIRVLDEFHRFTAAVNDYAQPRIDDVRAEFEAFDDGTLRDKVLERFIELAAQNAWLREYERCEVWLSTRKPCKDCLLPIDEEAFDPTHDGDHSKYYFEGRPDIDHLNAHVRNQLIAAYANLATDPAEGKDSPGIPASSDSSEPPAPPATAPSSGHAAAAV